ncbi:virulence RhuM family protein [Bacteroides thetaiotaomicron]|nr:virulence RhuM family protein [Bacteroides thetaiotaomicron]
MDEIEKNNGEIIIYRTEDGRTQLEVRLENENVWLSQQQIANLFGVQRPAITKHLRNIFESGELEENSVSSILEHTASDGKNYKTQFYNLDAIISVGYRVNSLQATHFRRWATERLKEYLIKGFAMDDKRLKEMGGGGYWYELLNRIRDIRSSEKVLYRQVLDLYATSVDYDPKADESIRFFKIVQNKLHYAAHGHTAAEVIFERADAEKPFMGLTTFPGEQPRKEDVLIAKNYLNEKELKILNNLVSGYFDFAEIQAIKRSPMYMSDYIHRLDLILSTTGEQVLQNTGTISHEQAKQKALGEYQKYHVKTLSPVEEAYFDSIKKLTAETKKKKKK